MRFKYQKAGRIRFLLFTLVFLSFPQFAFSFFGELLFLPPNQNYQKFQTAHFEWIYPKINEAAAIESSRILEQAYSELTDFFHYAPDHRVKIIFMDNQDSANGMASALGHQGLLILLTPPDPYSSIGEYEDWLKNVLIHEFAHYLTLEQRYGLFHFSKYFFGDVFFPNHAWPSWLAEGMAVYAETSFTRQGRGTGTFYQTLIRDSFWKKKQGQDTFLNYNQVSGLLPDFPFGEMPYYFGYAMMEEMAQSFGTASLSQFATESAFRLPFFLNTTLQASTGQDDATFQDLWQRWKSRKEKAVEKEIHWLTAHGTPEPFLFTEDKNQALGARFSPQGGKIAYFLKSGHHWPQLILQDIEWTDNKPNALKPQKLDYALSGSGLAWSPNEQFLFYAKADFTSPVTQFSDLFAYDLKNQDKTRLTQNERAKDPDWCKGGLIFTTNRNSESQLRFIEVDLNNLEAAQKKDIQVLYQAPRGSRIANPRCDAQGQWIYFSQHDAMTKERILRVKPGQDIHLVEHVLGGQDAGFSALYPEPTPQGDALLFTHVQDGYWSIARYSFSTGNIALLARSAGGYWMPSLTAAQPHWIAASYYSASGVYASAIPYPATPIKVIGKSKPMPLNETHQGITTSPESKPAVTPQPYSAFSSLLPRIWSPYLLLEPNHNQFGWGFLGWDDIDQIRYGIIGWFDTISQRPGGLFTTQYRTAHSKWSLEAESQVQSFKVRRSGRRNFDEDRKVGLTWTKPFRGVFENGSFSLIGEWSRTYRDGDFNTKTFAPQLRLGMRLNYDSSEQYHYSVSPERGLKASLEARHFWILEKEMENSWKFLGQIHPFFPLFFEHDALSIHSYFVHATRENLSNAPSAKARIGGFQGDLNDLDPPLRGFPQGQFFTQTAWTAQNEYRIPIFQWFRSPGHVPLFMKNISSFVFFDAAQLWKVDNFHNENHLATSIGFGLSVQQLLAYYIPLQIRIQFAHGFQQNLGGENAFHLGFQF